VKLALKVELVLRQGNSKELLLAEGRGGGQTKAGKAGGLCEEEGTGNI